MISSSTPLFFQFPTETSRRILHPLDVLENDAGAITARFHEPGHEPEPEQDVLIYYEIRREFMQQSARIVAVLETEPSTVFAFHTTGEPVSADSRECYRVSTALLDIPCTFGDERDRPVRDVSATGLAVISTQRLSIGDTLEVAFRYDGIDAKGSVCVQSVRELPDGEVRYGLHSIGKDKPSREFRDALNRISLAVQRLQLRRLSGAG